MRSRALLASLALFGCAGGGGTAAPVQPAPIAAETTTPTPAVADEVTDELVPYASEAGIARLARSNYRVDFFKLSNHYEGQQNIGMCGPTSAVIVLNTLRVDKNEIEKPKDPSLIPEKYLAALPKGFEPLFHRYSQGVFFEDERVTSVKSKDAFFGTPNAEGARDPGMQLRQLHQILGNLGLHSEIRVVDENASVETIRQEMRANLETADDYVIINYHRKALGQSGGGHISPIAAYDAVSDSFLIMDVNPNGKTWVWVRTEALVGAMRTKDTIENRGYLLVRDS